MAFEEGRSDDEVIVSRDPDSYSMDCGQVTSPSDREIPVDLDDGIDYLFES